MSENNLCQTKLYFNTHFPDHEEIRFRNHYVYIKADEPSVSILMDDKMLEDLITQSREKQKLALQHMAELVCNSLRNDSDNGLLHMKGHRISIGINKCLDKETLVCDVKKIIPCKRLGFCIEDNYFIVTVKDI